MEHGEITMPCLCELTIGYWSMLKSLPDHLPNSLKKLMIEHCDEVTWRPSSCHLPLLEELLLNGGHRKELPSSWTCLPNLKKLDNIESLNLISLPEGGWEQHELLHTLSIINCCQLRSLP